MRLSELLADVLSVHHCRYKRPSAVFALIGVVAATALSAAAPTPATGQAFGGAVLVAGDYILVGEAAHERAPGTVRAYAFQGGSWTQVAALQGPDAAVRDAFGISLARAGDFLFVGAGRGDGGVHVYRLADVGSSGILPLRTLEVAGMRGLGTALATSGDELVATAVTAGGETTFVTFRPGPDGSWEHSGTLTLGGAPRFGAPRFAVGGDLLATTDAESGAVKVFERTEDGRTWSPAGTLARPGPEDVQGVFGAPLAIHGSEILVGEMRIARADEGIVRTAAVHRFARSGGEWEEIGTLAGIEDQEVYELLLAVHGNTLLVGGGASVFAYEREGDDWALAGGWPVFGGEGEGSAMSLRTVALGDGIAAVGEPGADFGMGAVSVLAERTGEWAHAARLTAEHEPLPAITGGEIACDDGEAADYDCDHVDLLSFLPREEIGAARGARLNDVWGWTDPETGREYALVGRMDGASFVDVTDPYNPRYLGNLARTDGSPASTWRDIKVFKDHAFIVADGARAHGMQVFDLTQLRDVAEPREFEATAMYTDIGSVHNVAINEETGYAYLVGSSGGGETCGGGSHIVDINDPINPVFVGCFAHANTGRSNTGNSHDTQCVIYHGPDEDYRGREICVNSNETALSVADVTDKDNPLAIAKADYPNVAYAHQGWLTEDHRYFYSNDELDEVSGVVEATRTLIWDLADLDDPVMIKEYFSPTKVTDHNLYVRGDRLYMSNNRAGLRVLDISDPENPVELGYFDTTPWSADEAGFDGTWSVYPYFESGTVLLSSRREGLFLVRPRARRLIP